MDSLRESVRLFDGLIYDRHVYGKSPGCDPDLISGGVDPATGLEQEGMANLSMVDTTLLFHKFNAIVEEAREVYYDLSISEAIAYGDMGCGICTASGDPAVVATGIYMHVLLNYGPIKYIMTYYRDDPTVGVHDGDIFFYNDETCGCVHTFDHFLCMPIFYDGTLVAWATVGGHQGESGSIAPGGFAPTATQRWEEGFHIPALKIGENFQLRKDASDFLLNSVRNPFVFGSDLRARIGCCERIRRRLIREMEHRGVAPVVGALRKLIDFSSEQARVRLRGLNDGIFRSVVFDDTLGTRPALVRIPTVMIKEGDELTVVIAGVSPEHGQGPMQTLWHLARAGSAVYLFTGLFHGIPPNIGIFEPIRVLAEGPSIVNSSREVAHGEGTQPAAIIVQNLQVAGSKLLFDSPYREMVCAPQSRNVNLPIFGGLNRSGYLSFNIPGMTNAGGGGARFDMDGLDASGFFWGPYIDAGEAEEQDTRLTPLVLSRQVEQDYHGFGMWRGGGPWTEVSMGTHPLVHTCWGSADRLTTNPGLFGGYHGPPNPRFGIRDTDVLERMARTDPRLDFSLHALASGESVDGELIFTQSSVKTEEFKAGDLFVYNLGAAGGYGDVLERHPDDVLTDVVSEIISIDLARDLYCVVIEGGAVDIEATTSAREARRRERLDRGKSFDDFTRDWLGKHPEEPGLLDFYGHWPEPRVPDGYDKPYWGMYADLDGAVPIPPLRSEDAARTQEP